MINFLIQAGTISGCKNLIGGLMLGATTLFANPEAPTKPMSFDASVYVTNAGKIRVSVEKAAPGFVSVEMRDQQQHILFNKLVNKKEMKACLLLDISQLGDGMYTLNIKSAEGSIQKQVNVSTPKAERTIQFQ